MFYQNPDFTRIIRVVHGVLIILSGRPLIKLRGVIPSLGILVYLLK